MRAQTNRHVYVSVNVPTGYADKVMHVEVLDGALGRAGYYRYLFTTLLLCVKTPVDDSQPV